MGGEHESKSRGNLSLKWRDLNPKVGELKPEIGGGEVAPDFDFRFWEIEASALLQLLHLPPTPAPGR